MRGTSTFPVEVTNVSRHGLWVLVGDEELFLPFQHFPWFLDASIEKISVIERQMLTAVQNAITKAEINESKMRWFKVIETRGYVGNGKVAHWQVRVKIGVTLDD